MVTRRIKLVLFTTYSQSMEIYHNLLSCSIKTAASNILHQLFIMVIITLI